MTDGMKYKVLIVDDDKFLLQMYSLKFTHSGHEVVSARSAQEAIDKLKEGYVPEIMIMDMVMPGMDGLELLQKVHDEKLAEGAVFVMLTNQSAPTDIERAKQIGINGYIVKATTIPSEVVEEVIKIKEKSLSK